MKASDGNPGRPLTVLVVDDEPMILELVARYLRHQGCAVLTAGCALEAMLVFRAADAPVDLLVTDVNMPDLSGPELAAYLTELNPGMSVLFVSGGHLAETHGSLNGPRSAFLAKPFRLDSLTSTVRSLLRAA